MNIQELARLVHDMRNAQQTFFRDRSRQAIDRAKQLEKQVDRAIADILSQQPRLFGDEP